MNDQSIALGMLFLTGIIVFLALRAASGTLRSAEAAEKAVKAQLQAVEAQLLLIFFTDYSSPDMSEALRLLKHWKEEEGDGFAKKWLKKFNEEKEKDGEAHKVDRARRKVAHYFWNALRLHESGYVGKDFFCTVASADGIRIFYDIVEPLECVFTPGYDESRSKRIKEICGAPPPISSR